MKNQFLIAAVAVFSFFLVSCGGGESQSAGDAQAPAQAPATALSFNIDPATSIVGWVGKKELVASQHNGTVPVKSGFLKISENTISEGKFVLDMANIDNEDLAGTDGHGKLLGHLKSDDFFAVATFPEATFEVSSATILAEGSEYTHEVTGNLTLKGITKSITFPAKVSIEGSTITAVADKVVINRADWEVKFGSTNFFAGLVGDKIISNDILISIVLKGNAVEAAL